MLPQLTLINIEKEFSIKSSKYNFEIRNHRPSLYTFSCRATNAMIGHLHLYDIETGNVSNHKNICLGI